METIETKQPLLAAQPIQGDINSRIDRESAKGGEKKPRVARRRSIVTRIIIFLIKWSFYIFMGMIATAVAIMVGMYTVSVTKYALVIAVDAFLRFGIYLQKWHDSIPSLKATSDRAEKVETMKILLLVLVFCVAICSSIDESPVASLTCQFCSSGATFFTSRLLPNGMSCLDLDAAMRNIGKSGCFGLRSDAPSSEYPDGVNPNNATQSYQAYKDKEKQYESEKDKSAKLTVGIASLVVILLLTIAAFGVAIYIIIKRSKGPVIEQTRGRKNRSFVPQNDVEKVL